jgi:ABC-2 type transport system permease protein
MNSDVAQTAGDVRPNPAPPAAAPTGRVFVTLVSREFWEHRALWIAPLAVAALIAVSALWVKADLDSHDIGRMGPFPGQTKAALFTIVQWALSMPLFIAALFVLFFYALDCLYAERKDRSILFWKSMPVSDGMTVASKALTALVVVPVGVFLLAAVNGLLFFLIFWARTSVSGAPPVLAWDTLEWFRGQAALLLMLILAMLWYAPLAAALMLLSAWVRRNPFVWLTVPLGVAPLLERIIFGTTYLWSFLSYRLGGCWYLLGLHNSHILSHQGIRPFGTLLEELTWRNAFLNADLWLGVAVAVALFYAAARIRRYRDDT